MVFWKRSADPRAELKDLIGGYELPSFSAGAVSTLGLLREDADLDAIAERIMVDPGLSVRVLRTVNSAAFGLRREVSNLAYATSLLGRSRLEALVLSVAVGEALPAPNGLDMAVFWQTAARRACLARKLAASLQPALELESFTAGLLQDMAVPVLAASHPDRYPSMYMEAESDRAGVLHSLERDAFGYDHAQVGAMMAEVWDLPEPLITAIADHHLPGERSPEPVEAVAHIRHGESDELESLREHCATRLSVAPAALDAMIEAASAESDSLAESMRTGVPGA